MTLTGSLIAALGRFAADGFTLQRRGKAARRSLRGALQLARWLDPPGRPPAFTLRSGAYDAPARLDWSATLPADEGGVAAVLQQETAVDGDRLIAAWRSGVRLPGELALYRRNTLLEPDRLGDHRDLRRWPSRPPGAASPLGRVQILTSGDELAQALVAGTGLIPAFLAANEALAAPPGRAFVPAELLCDRIHFHYQDGNAFLVAAPAAAATLADARALGGAAAALERSLHAPAPPPDPELIGEEIHGITLLRREFQYGAEFPFGRLRISPQRIAFFADERRRDGGAALLDLYERYKNISRPALSQFRFDFPRGAITAIRYPPERPGQIDVESRDGRWEFVVATPSHQPLLLALSREGYPLA